MTMYHVAGIDLSLSDTGVAVIRGDGESPSTVTHCSVKSEGEKSLELEDGTSKSSLLDRRNRLQHIAARVITAATAGWEEGDAAPLFMIEAPLYRAPMRRDPHTGQQVPIQGGGHAHDRAGVWWILVHLLHKKGYVAEVSTTTLKRYASGTGAGKKVGVLLAIPRMFPQYQDLRNDNRADALVLAAMGARQLRIPVEPSVQRVTPDALNSVQWPQAIRNFPR